MTDEARAREAEAIRNRMKADIAAVLKERDEQIERLTATMPRDPQHDDCVVVLRSGFVAWGTEFSQLRSRLAAAEKVVEDLLGLVDDGILVRDISRDHEHSWALRQIPLVKTVAAARKFLDDAGRKP